MLKFGNVSFAYQFEVRRPTKLPDVAAKISMLRLNIGSGMLRLSSCILRLVRLGLRLSFGSRMLRLGLRLWLRLIL